MMDKQYKTKIENIVSEDVLDNLKSINNSFSSNEKKMFDNNLTVPSEETENIININDHNTNEENYVKLFSKAETKCIIYLISLIVAPIVIGVMGCIIFLIERMNTASLYCLFINSIIVISSFLFLNDVGVIFYKDFKNLIKDKDRQYKKEISEERFKFKGDFVNPRIVGINDELFHVLNKIYANNYNLYNSNKTSDDVLKELIKYNIVAKVQFNGKDNWIPEDKYIRKYVNYEYDTPRYAATNNAINVFIDDDGISEMIFKETNRNKKFIVTKNMLKENPDMENVINVLCLMNVLTKRPSKNIKGNIINFGPRYEAYRTYMENK